MFNAAEDSGGKVGVQEGTEVKAAEEGILMAAMVVEGFMTVAEVVVTINAAAAAAALEEGMGIGKYTLLVLNAGAPLTPTVVPDVTIPAPPGTKRPSEMS